MRIQCFYRNHDWSLEITLEYSVERDIFFISVNAYFKCSVGLRIDKRSGASCTGWFILPPPRFSERIDNQQFLLHHLLQKYLVERDINFILVNQRCLHQMFIWGTYWQGAWGVVSKLSRLVYLGPHLEFRREWIIGIFHYTIYYSLSGIFSWKGYRLVSNVQLGYILTRGGGQAVQAGLSYPPPHPTPFPPEFLRK